MKKEFLMFRANAPLKFTLSIFVLAAASQMLSAADFVLAAVDRAPAPIVLVQNAPPRTREAALALVDILICIGNTRALGMLAT